MVFEKQDGHTHIIEKQGTATHTGGIEAPPASGEGGEMDHSGGDDPSIGRACDAEVKRGEREPKDHDTERRERGPKGDGFPHATALVNLGPVGPNEVCDANREVLLAEVEEVPLACSRIKPTQQTPVVSEHGKTRGERALRKDVRIRRSVLVQPHAFSAREHGYMRWW